MRHFPPNSLNSKGGKERIAVEEKKSLIDKNSLWGGLNIQKRELCVKGIEAQDLGFVGGPFQRGFGGFSG